ALHHLLKTCRSIDPQLKGRQGGSKLLNKHARNLTDRQAQRLAVYLERWPAIERIYRFKEELMEVLSAKNQSKKQCRSWARCLLDAIAQLQQSGFRAYLVLIVSLCPLFLIRIQLVSKVRTSETTQIVAKKHLPEGFATGGRPLRQTSRPMREHRSLPPSWRIDSLDHEQSGSMKTRKALASATC
ncbi:MAG: transposase, partial [Roseovarius sp.]|nr:transposase [Roseovarius sp.]